MASVAAAVAAASALGVYYGRRLVPSAEIRDFTEPPQTWGESVLRLHEVVRISWQEALSKLGVWRLDHLLAGGVREQRLERTTSLPRTSCLQGGCSY